MKPTAMYEKNKKFNLPTFFTHKMEYFIGRGDKKFFIISTFTVTYTATQDLIYWYVN